MIMNLGNGQRQKERVINDTHSEYASGAKAGNK